MTFDRIPAWADELLRASRVGRLGLLDEDDRPRVQPVTFALAGVADLQRDRPEAEAHARTGAPCDSCAGAPRWP